MDLKSFQEKITHYCQAVNKKQKNLAEELNLHPKTLSHKLNGSKSLLPIDVKSIVKVLVAWEAINTTQEINEVMNLANCPPFTTTDWQTVPLSHLLENQPSKNQKTTPNNLPLQVTSFIGREHEMNELTNLLTQQGQSLISLTGPGGGGKTRLALEVAYNLLPIFSDGIWFVDLASLNEALLVPNKVAKTIGISEQLGQSVTESLVRAFKSSNALLLLDNCEHLIDACASLITNLLQTCTRLKILATSRERLWVQGEHVWVVPMLELPSTTENLPVKELNKYEGIRLFVERAKLVLHTFRLGSGNAKTVIEICQKLDGIPLAIELAAARLNAYSVEQLRNNLDKRFRLLTGNDRTILPRQQTLWALVDWSYNLLSVSEGLLFKRLAVFVGGWSGQAAEQVCSDQLLKSEEISDLLGLLVNKSLIYLEEEAEGNIRYKILETIRQYALISPLDARQHLKERHAIYYLKLAETGFNDGNDQDFHKLETDYANFREALFWYLQSEQVENGLKLVLILEKFWFQRGYLEEGFIYLKKVAENLEKLNIRLETSLDIYYVLSTFAWQLGLYEVGKSFAEKSYLSREQIGDKKGMALSLRKILNISYARGQYQDAKEFAYKSLALSQEAEDDLNVAKCLHSLACIFIVERDLSQARISANESLKIYRKLDSKLGIADLLDCLARLEMAELETQEQEGKISADDYNKALNYINESLSISRQINDEIGVSRCLMSLGVIYYYQEQYSLCKSLCNEVILMNRGMNRKEALTEGFLFLGLVLVKLYNFQEAKKALLEGLKISYETENSNIVQILDVFAKWFWLLGGREEAITIGGCSASIRKTMNTNIYADGLVNYQDLLLLMKNTDFFSDAWSRGSHLIQEQIVDYILDKCEGFS